ncbi:MAG: aldehyde dehydrogenase family protein [bacterium JZ-2024 1]
MSFVRIKEGHYYANGKWMVPEDGRTYNDINPATEEVIARIAQCSAKEVDVAVRSAREAFDDGRWRWMKPSVREALLLKLADTMEAHADEVATLETLDAGKPLRDNKNIDVPMSIEIIRYYAGWATKIHGETLPAHPNAMLMTLREPLGVVGAIVPWNFPLLLAVWKIAPALAAGNTVVVKPSRETPLTMLKLAEIAEEAGLPPGVFNVVTGSGGETGMALVRHPGVDKIAFTGSTETGKFVMRESAETLKRVTLELGGKSPNVVLEDADMDVAARGVLAGIFYNQGECCSAGSRLIVSEEVHDELLGRVAERASRWKPGDPFDEKTRVGPLISAEHRAKVMGFIEKGVQEGATILAGGGIPEGLPRGYFINPTILDNVKPEDTLAREEVFGPVLSVIRVKTLEEAVRVANSSIYGLAAAVWTRDIRKALEFARRAQAGTVWVNTYNEFDAGLPFGGFKQSGFGRELGSAAIEAYTQVKSLWVSL